MNDDELRTHNDRAAERRDRWAREHGYENWADYKLRTEPQ